MIRSLIAAVLLAATIPAANAVELDALSQTALGLKAVLASAPKKFATADDPATARQKMLDEKLLSAVSSANVAEIKRLVSLGANPNAYDGYHFTPLQEAVISHGDPDTVNALLALGAQVDGKGTCDYTALHEAAGHGRLEAARILVAHHASIDAKGCLGDTPLNEAAANRQPELFQYLLGLGADPNAAGYRGKAPINYAAEAFVAPKDNAILAALLADRRVNVNAHDEDGMTPLKTAAKGNNLDLVNVLLAAPGIDVNDNSGGTSALFLAELNNYAEVAQALRAAGAKTIAAR